MGNTAAVDAHPCLATEVVLEQAAVTDQFMKVLIFRWIALT